MDRDNSIEEMLKRLRSSYEDKSADEPSEDPERDAFTYHIDDDFLEDAKEAQDAPNSLAKAELEAIEEIADSVENEELIAEPEEDELPFDLASEIEAETEDEYDDEPPFDLVDEILVEAESETVEALTEEAENTAFSFFDEDDGVSFDELENASEEEIFEVEPEEVAAEEIAVEEIDEEYFDTTEDDESEDDEGIFIEDENGDIVFVSAEGEVVEDEDVEVYEPEEEQIEDACEETYEKEAPAYEPEDILSKEPSEMEDAPTPVKFKTLITGYDASEEKYERYIDHSVSREEPEEIEDEVFVEDEADMVAEEDTIDLGEYFSANDGQLAMFEKTAAEGDMAADILSDTAAPTLGEDQIRMDLEDAELRHKRVVSEAPISELDDSVIALMLELEGRDFVEDSVGAAGMDRIEKDSYKASKEQVEAAAAFAFDGDEYETYEQTEEIFDSYAKEKALTLMRVIGCAFFVVLVSILELFRFIGIGFEGFLDYTTYPVVYNLITVQLLILSALFAWREIYDGFKRAFTYNVGNWSAVSIVFAFTMLYDIPMAFIRTDNKAYSFCTVSALYILFGLVTEYLAVSREQKSFRVYASENNKFTFNTDPRRIKTAEKMYRGGVSEDSAIFEPVEIKFPSGYFSAVNCQKQSERALRASGSIIIALSVVVLLLNVILGNDAGTAFGMFMISITALAPVAVFAYHTLPIYKLSSKLYEREIAVAGEVAAKRYAECDYIIFKDMHLFKRAKPQNNGISFYDKSKADCIVEYLDALYSTIGGPMKDTFGGAGESLHSVKLRRVAKDGIEAVIDAKHSVLLGNAEFMQRYGVSFGDMTSARRGDGMLGFAIDGSPAAKLCLRYQTEPLFEKIAERLSEEGIQCVIETYDPVIGGKYVSECRAPYAPAVNVIHKNAADFYSSSTTHRNEDTGIVVCSSRFKLAEGVIWCKRVARILKLCSVFQFITYGLALAGVVLTTVFGIFEYVNQYTVLLLQAISMLPTIIATALGFPNKDYFSTETQDNH
ncbi:MAG: hypothetical protein J6V42_00930 [Clostridia bacterium]|nr:hypothetical protein [Clostridia bacterium]